MALLASYSYVQLALHYKDEGATYSFYKKTFPKSDFAAAMVGWLIVFGYISTIALYAFTFSSYLCGLFELQNVVWIRDAVAGGIILLFAIVNIVSVKGMGRMEDLLVYSKIIILLVISGLLVGKGESTNLFPLVEEGMDFKNLFIVAAVTFVAFEGFQLVIHAYNEMDEPQKNVPRAIYSSIAIASLLYIVLSVGALYALPKELIIRDKEFALASGASEILGGLGLFIGVFGALLATASAISGTLFGASRLMAVIANDGHFPAFLGKKIKEFVPVNAILLMSALSFILILSGGLETILEFGSITFILVSFLMAWANFKVAKQQQKSTFLPIVAMLGLSAGIYFILYYELTEEPEQLMVIFLLYGVLTLSAFVFLRFKSKRSPDVL